MKQFTIIVILFILTSCISPTSPTKETLEAVSLTSAPTYIVKLTATPKIVTTTPPAWTALPTFSTDTGVEIMSKLLEGNVDCLLPCWAGITPGVTSWDETQHLIEPLSGLSKLEYYLNQSCTFGGCDHIRWSFENGPDWLGEIGHIYSELPQDKIQFIALDVNHPNLVVAIDLKEVLKKYGKPSIILFSSEPDLPGWKTLEVIMVYPEKHFIIKYAKHAEIKDNTVEACDKEPDSVVRLFIFDSDEQLLSLDKIENSIELESLNINSNWHKSVEEAVGMTLKDFYETHSKEDSPCIIVPTSLWLP